MDTHDLGHGRGGIEQALARITQPSLVVSISSDGLYHPKEQQLLHRLLPNSELFTVQSDSGHDGFLLDQDVILPVALQFLKRAVPEAYGSARL